MRPNPYPHEQAETTEELVALVEENLRHHARRKQEILQETPGTSS